METTGTQHLFYRCYRCGAGITCLQIQDIWAKATDAGEHLPLCSCGSRHISPGNPKWWEELIYPSIWKLWWVKVFKPWYAARSR